MEKRGQYRKNNFGMLWFIINLILGLYFLNKGLNLIPLSFITESINNILIIIGGILIIISGVMSMRKSSSAQMMR
jgi:hypothetical protein